MNREELIELLIQNNIFKTEDGKQLWELSDSELIHLLEEKNIYELCFQ